MNITDKPITKLTNPIIRSCFSSNLTASDIILRQKFGNAKGKIPSKIKTNAMAEIRIDSKFCTFHKKGGIHPPFQSLKIVLLLIIKVLEEIRFRID